MFKSITLLLLLTVSVAQAWKDQTLVVGYLMNWRPVPAPERVAHLTHLYMTGFFPDATLKDGTLDTTRHEDVSKINELITIGDSVGTDIMIMVGGWGNHAGFSEIVLDSNKRVKFAEQIRDYCLRYGFKGADVDWEFPEEGEFENYEKLMKELKEKFTPHNLLLTSAIGQDHYDKFTMGTWQYLDWVNIMAYDMSWARLGSSMPDNHSPHEVHIDLFNRWEAHGIPKEKLVMGVPFYARLTLNWGDAIAYDEVYRDYSPSASENIAGGYNFNGPNTIYNKANYAVAKGYGGVMVWEIEHDLEFGDTGSLHSAMIEGVEDALAGVEEVKPVTLDVNIDATTSSLVVPTQLQGLGITLNQGVLSNQGTQDIQFELVNMKGASLQGGTLHAGSTQELSRFKQGALLRVTPLN